MGFRAGFVVGGAIGYYFGARAGRERYVQLNRMLRRVRNSPAFETAAEKARSAVDAGVDKAKDAIESKTVDGRSGATPPLLSG
jgi:hypothetical protein